MTYAYGWSEPERNGHGCEQCGRRVDVAGELCDACWDDGSRCSCCGDEAGLSRYVPWRGEAVPLCEACDVADQARGVEQAMEAAE